MGLFAGKQQFKVGLHVHTTNSDGTNSLSSVVEQHYSRDYDILAITDHSTYPNSMTRDWRTSPGGVSSARFDVIASGSDRGGRPMLMIPNTIEQSYHDHVNTFFIDYHPTTFSAVPDDPHFVSRGRAMEYPGIPEQYTLSNLERTLQEIDDRGGLSHINHPGRYTGAGTGSFPVGPSNDPANIKKYADLFLAYRSCVGLSIINKQDGESRNDRILWDNINRVTIADPTRPRLVWGFSNDDSHANSETGYSFNVMLMPELTLAAFREAMNSGSFYAVARVARREGVINTNRDSVTPVITDIEVSSTRIRVVAENYDRVEWVAAGTSTLPLGEVVNPHEFSDTGPFVRAAVIGTGGVAFTQPIRVRRMRSMAIEILTQVKKPVAPVDDEDVARKVDITTVQGTLQSAINNRAARAGDIGGTDTSSTVQAWRGRSLSTAAPTANQAYLWSGTLWNPGSVLLLSGGTLTGNLYLPAGTPTLATQAITLGYLNTRINEFVTSGGNQFPDAPSSPQYTFGRRYDKTWQQVVTPNFTGEFNVYTNTLTGRGRIALGDSGGGLHLSPQYGNRGEFYIGTSTAVTLGWGCSFTMAGGGKFAVNTNASFKGWIRTERRRATNYTPQGQWMGDFGGGVMLDRNTRFLMAGQTSGYSAGPDGWPRANFRVDSLAAFNSPQVWFNGKRTTFKETAAFSGLVTIGDPSKGWRPQDRVGRVRVYRGSFTMDRGGRFKVDSLSEIDNYLTIRRSRTPRVWQTGGPPQPGQPSNYWNEADWSGGGGIVLDRGTIFDMARQYSSNSGLDPSNPGTSRRANFRVGAMASFGTSVWLNGKMYSYGDTTFNHALWAWGGTFSFTGSNWATVSDRNVKQDVEPYERGLADILKLQPVWFRYSGRRGSPSPGRGRQVSLIAQDVQPVMPEMVGAVHGRLGPTEFLEDHPERIPTDMEEPAEETLTLDTSALIYAVVNSLKEVDHRLQVLEAHIALPSAEPPHPEPPRRPGRRR